MRAKTTIKNPTPTISDAIQAINEYQYRKEMGLSYDEFMDEPLEVFLLNIDIMSAIAEIENEKIKGSAKI